MGTFHTGDDYQRDGGPHDEDKLRPTNKPLAGHARPRPRSTEPLSSSHGPSSFHTPCGCLPSIVAGIPTRGGDPRRGCQGPESALLLPRHRQRPLPRPRSDLRRPLRAHGPPQAKVEWNEISPFASSHVRDSTAVVMATATESSGLDPVLGAAGASGLCSDGGPLWGRGLRGAGHRQQLQSVCQSSRWTWIHWWERE